MKKIGTLDDDVVAKLESNGIHVTEGVSGYYSYHLSELGINAKSLCGAKTMLTSVPLASWGAKGHLNEKYCAECAQLATNS